MSSLQESLKKVLQEKLEAIQKLTEIEVSNMMEKSSWMPLNTQPWNYITDRIFA